MAKSNTFAVMKVLLVFCVIAIISICITSLVSNGKEIKNNTSTQHAVSEQSPAITVIKHESSSDNNRYSYVIDRRTGVVYLEYNSYRSHGLTVMMNPDGTVITADQLGLEYEPYIDIKE